MNIEDHLGIEPNLYGFKYFSENVIVNVLDNLFTAIDESYDGVSLDVKPVYSIYMIQLQTGQRMAFLIVDKNRKIPLGENELYLAPLKGRNLYIPEENDLYLKFIEHPPNRKTLTTMAKGYISQRELDLYKTNENLAKYLIEELNSNVNLFYQLTTGVPVTGVTAESNLLKILTQDKVNNLLTDYLTDGMHKDPLLLFSFKPNLLQVNSEIVRPQDIMPYMEHQVTFTNSKVGKTTLADKVGVSIVDAKISNLLGFSTAQDINKGSLNEVTNAVAFDEIHENKNKDEWGKLLNLMEQGKADVRKGKRMTICKTYAPLRFMSNPHYKVKGEEKVTSTLNWEDYDLLHTLIGMFESMITTITDNFAAFSSRMAMTTFSKTLNVASGTAYPRDTQIKLKKIISTIFELTRDDFSKLYLEQSVLDFLNSPYDSDYLDAVDSVLSYLKIPNLKDYLQGHKDNYRHTRGMAFKLGCLDSLMDLLRLKLMKGKQICFDCKTIKEDDAKCNCHANNWVVIGSPIFMNEMISAILASANNYFDIIKDENLKSFKIIAEQVNTNVYKNYYSMMLNKESQHIRTLVFAVRGLNPSVNQEIPYKDIHMSEAIATTNITLSKGNIFERILKRMPYNNLIFRRYGFELITGSSVTDTVVKVLEPYALKYVTTSEEKEAEPSPEQTPPDEMTAQERAIEHGLSVSTEHVS